MDSERDDELLPLAIELMTSSIHDDEKAFLAHVEARCQEELKTPGEALRLIVLLSAFGGNAVRAWAEDTDRDPSAVMQAIGLQAALGADEDSNG